MWKGLSKQLYYSMVARYTKRGDGNRGFAFFCRMVKESLVPNLVNWNMGEWSFEVVSGYISSRDKTHSLDYNKNSWIDL